MEDKTKEGISRLLTDKDAVITTVRGIQVSARTFKNECFSNVSREDIDYRINTLLKAQDAKTASMFQQRLDDIYRRIAEQGIIGNYNATGKYLCDLSPLLQALKKQEGMGD